MDIIFTRHMDAVEKYHIYWKTEKGMQVNDRNTFAKNKIFDMIVKHDPQ